MVDGRTNKRTDTHTHTYLPTSSVPFSLFQLHCLLNSLQYHLAPSHYPRALALAAFSALIPCSNTFSQSALSSPSLCSNVTCAGYTPGLESMLASSYSLPGHFILLAHLPVLHSTRRFHQGRASAHVPCSCSTNTLSMAGAHHFVKFKNGRGLGYTAEMAQWLRKPFILAEDLSSSPSTHTGL